MRFLGTDVSHAVVSLDNVVDEEDASGASAVLIAVLGLDMELFHVPTELTARNMTFTVPDSNARFDVACARAHGDVNVLKTTNVLQPRVGFLLQGIENKTLALRGNGHLCTDADFSDNVTGLCTYVNVTEYTSLFGYKFEHRFFRNSIRTDIVAWVLLVMLSILSGALGIVLLFAVNRSHTSATDSDDGYDSSDSEDADELP